MPRSIWLWPAIIGASALAAGLLALLDVASPLRPLAALWFMAICPGMAFVRLLRLDDPVAEWSLAIALSIALDAIVAAVILYSGVRSFKWGLGVLIVLSLIGTAIQLGVGRARSGRAREV